MAIAELRSIVKTYVMGESVVEALKGVSIAFEKGDFWAIMGPSGSGKSTLLNVIGCLDSPDSGEYILDGKDVARMNDRDLSGVRGETLGFIFQSFNLIPQLNVVENIEVPLFYQGLPPKIMRKKAMSLAEQVGLGDHWHHRPSELSGGQQQRVAIARSLVNDPVLVLADEPTGNLDSTTGAEIMEMLRELHAKGTTIIMVTHEDEVASFAEHVLKVRDGEFQEVRRDHRAGSIARNGGDS